jgi:hypothetical protein
MVTDVMVGSNLDFMISFSTHLQKVAPPVELREFGEEFRNWNTINILNK